MTDLAGITYTCGFPDVEIFRQSWFWTSQNIDA
jgi:hypothetical protein